MATSWSELDEATTTWNPLDEVSTTWGVYDKVWNVIAFGHGWFGYYAPGFGHGLIRGMSASWGEYDEASTTWGEYDEVSTTWTEIT